MAYLPLPGDTKEVFSKNKNQSDNAFLLFNRYLEGEGFNFETIDLNTAPFVQRSEASLARLKKSGYLTRTIKLKSVSRLIVGLGDKNALEVGFTFHPLYGYPYIPGSSLKGLCRSWLEIAENEFDGKVLQDEDLQSEIDQESRQIFGSFKKDEKNIPEYLKRELESRKESVSKLGDVLFFDAIPTEDTKLDFDIDIMNPHYSEYYTDPKKSPPGDWYSPVPIKFLTIKEGATFAFYLASRNEKSLDKAEKWLLNGLSELGIGSKTSSGYGYFQHPDESKRLKELEDAKEAERLAKEEDERPDWAKAMERELSEAKEEAVGASISDDESRILGLLEKDPALFLNSAVEIWNSIEVEELKIKMAKAFFEKQSKFMKKKVDQKKKYALNLVEWANKS